MPPATPHLPRQASIEAYGNGGFRFAEMSHRGSLLCLPSGIWAWNVARAEEIDEDALTPVMAEAREIDFLIVGTGETIRPLPEALRWRLRELHISVEVLSTGAAIRTYNIVLGEGRRVAAALVAVA
ncbi:MAG TPA: MTH938/NDUFAF3 family protein [Xanthobacteraceae bacterium]|nr:MTH938/NDUFAF3 family protein [Xanthobacteraceae bacterium]